MGHSLCVVDHDEFALQREQFFGRAMLDGIREPADHTPTLVDCGANIGLCVLWFKRAFPHGTVVAIEPDPAVARCLIRNVHAAGLDSVEVLEAAAWVSDGEVTMSADGVCGSRLSDPAVAPTDDRMDRIVVDAVDLRARLLPQTTLLKLDVEGAELVLLQHCEAMLPEAVTYIHVEVHEFVGQPRRLPVVLDLLERTGFEYHLHPLHVDPQPFAVREAWRSVVNPMAVFAWKPGHGAPVVETATGGAGQAASTRK